MALSVGEFFLDIGIKGADKTVNAIGTVKGSLQEAKSMSLEMKAALFGLLYGFEKLTSHALHVGQSLTNFNTLTGIATDTLQRYQYVAGEAGASTQELDAAFKGVQNSIATLQVERTVPPWMARMGNFMAEHGKSKINVNELIGPNGTEYLFRWYQEFLNLPIAAQVKKKLMEGSGIGGENVLAAMMRNKFTPENLAKAPTLSNNEVDVLNRTQEAWYRLGKSMEFAFSHFTARHGAELARDIGKLIPPVIHLVEALDKLATKLHAFDFLAKVIDVIGNTIGLSSEAIDALNGTSGYGKHPIADKLGLTPPPEILKSAWLGQSVGKHGGLDLVPNRRDFSQKEIQQLVQQNIYLQHRNDQELYNNARKGTKDATQSALRQIPVGNN